MIGTPEAPLFVPYDVMPKTDTRPAPRTNVPLAPLQEAHNTPAPSFPNGTMWKLDGKGGYIQVFEGKPLSSDVYIAKDGRL